MHDLLPKRPLLTGTAEGFQRGKDHLEWKTAWENLQRKQDPSSTLKDGPKPVGGQRKRFDSLSVGLFLFWGFFQGEKSAGMLGNWYKEGGRAQGGSENMGHSKEMAATGWR